MENIKPILEQFAEILKSDVKTVTKRFSNSIESEVSENSIRITGSPYISVLIDGRKPTRPNAPKGDPTFQEIIYQWIKEKGIQAHADKNGKIMSQLSLSWAISQYIHNYGDRLYRAGGGNNIFASIVNQQRIASFTNSLGSIFASSVSSDLIKDLK